VTSLCPCQKWFIIWDLGLGTVNLTTSFQLSISFHYENMKGNTKCQKWSGLGKLGVTSHWIKRIRIPTSFFNSYVPILHRFWDIVRYWSKVVDFDLVPVFGAPVGMTPLEFAHYLWRKKSRIYGFVSMILGSALLVKLRLVTDRQINVLRNIWWQHIPL